MIAVQVTAVDVAGAVLWLLAVVVVLWRWPALVLGLGVALALWTLAPWVSRLAQGTVEVAAVEWRWAGRGRVVWAVLGRLAGTGWWGPAVAAVVAVLGPGSVAAGGRVVLVLLGVGSLARLVEHRRRQGAAVRGPGAGLAGPVSGPLGVERSAHLVVQGPCPDCGGQLAATVPLAGAGRLEGAVTGWATCAGCGTRRVAVVDPERPEAGPVWLALPDAGEWVEGIVPRGRGG
ncbi:MAG: hypothetical protein ACRD2C_08760 [Acidimicrobiales bacterium]